jgi:integrase
MAKAERLTALKVERIKDSGMYADGRGLYLQVTVNSRNGEPAKSWIYRYMLRGRAREMGLGPLHTVGLSLARDLALRQRQLRLQGVDPIEARRVERARGALAAARAVTFKECAEKYMAGHKAAWRNAKHAAQWEATLATYAEPLIGALSVQAIDTALVMKVLEQEIGSAPGKSWPLWTARPETASRLRGRIEVVLDWAKVRGYREGENPARWRGHLDKLLPARAKVQKVEHHAAIPYAEVPELLTVIRAQEGTAARALEFAILTAARTGEVIGARRGEMNIADRLWTVPAARMKGGREHRVPLSPRCVEMLEEMKSEHSAPQNQESAGGFMFTGRKIDQPLSNMAFLMLLRRIGRSDLTAHGFRSTFRDWAAERTNFPREVAEMALAHAVGDKVEAAYRRGDLFERRRRIMAEWAKFCAAVKPSVQSKVVRIARND